MSLWVKKRVKSASIVLPDSEAMSPELVEVRTSRYAIAVDDQHHVIERISIRTALR